MYYLCTAKFRRTGNARYVNIIEIRDAEILKIIERPWWNLARVEFRIRISYDSRLFFNVVLKRFRTLYLHEARTINYRNTLVVCPRV